MFVYEPLFHPQLADDCIGNSYMSRYRPLALATFAMNPVTDINVQSTITRSNNSTVARDENEKHICAGKRNEDDVNSAGYFRKQDPSNLLINISATTAADHMNVKCANGFY
jgi:hypothetical protein